MSPARIKGPASVVLFNPGDRMPLTIFTSLIGTFVYGDEHFYIRIKVPEVVPLIRSGPYRREGFSSGVMGIPNMKIGLLDSWVVKEIRAHQLAVPLPIKFGIGSCMYSNKASPFLNVPFKDLLLFVVEYIPRSIIKDYSGILV